MEDEISFEEFMAARWVALYRFAYVLTGDHHRAEDTLQDVMARTSVRWRSIRDKGAAEAYVRRGLVHQAARGWRRRGREVLVDLTPDGGHGGGIDARVDHLLLWEEIRRLPPRMRAALVLRYLEDLSERDTARLLGVSVGSVKNQTHHALRRLRAAIPADVDVAEEVEPCHDRS